MYNPIAVEAQSRWQVAPSLRPAQNTWGVRNIHVWGRADIHGSDTSTKWVCSPLPSQWVIRLNNASL